MRKRFADWYFHAYAGRHCPCQWRVKMRPLMWLCGRIDDWAFAQINR